MREVARLNARTGQIESACRLIFRQQAGQIRSEYALSTTVDIPAIRTLHKYLKESAILISVDRVPDCETELWWSSGLQNAGLAIDCNASGQLSVKDIGGEESLPIFVCRVNERKVDSTDLLSFVVSKHEGSLKSLSVDKNEAFAELLFLSFNPKEFVAGWKAVYKDGSGTAHFEVWQSGVFILSYMWTTRGYRQLEIGPAYLSEQILKTTEAQVDKHRPSAAVTKLEMNGRAECLLEAK